MNSAASPISSFAPISKTPAFRAFDLLGAPDCCTFGIQIELYPPATEHAEAVLIAAFALVLAKQTSRHELYLSVATEQGTSLADAAPLRLDLQAPESVGDWLAALSRLLAEAAGQRARDLNEASAVIRLDCIERIANIGYCVEITRTADANAVAHCWVLAPKDANFSELSEVLAGRLPHVAQWLAAHSRSPLSDCDTVAPSERRRIERFSSAACTRDVSRDLTIHGLFEAQARRAPHATAVIFGDVGWSYGQLDDISSRLAVCLRSRFALQPEQRVAVVAKRSHLLIAALLGIMKAGCGYAPIDPRHPIERVARMIDDVDPAVLIVDAENAAAAARYDRETFVMDIELEHLAPVPDSFASLGGPRSVAYTIFTSGSTGRPNAVAVEHRAIVNTILWRNEFYGISQQDVNLQLPSFAFDSSVVDIFGFLAAGASLVILDEERGLDPEYIGALCEQHGVTRLLATPSYYKQLCGCLAGSSRMNSVTVAGEATSADLVSMHFRNLPGVRLVNEYGPTENAVCSTAIDLRQGERSIPIGTPVPNTSLYVLDSQLRLTGIGVPGEVYLAGAGLARGYVSQPKITAARFLPCPFAAGGARMYRTGDWAFWRPDGVLEFLGRRDRQVKIRGFRIELDDIEAVLTQFPGVTSVLAMAKDPRVKTAASPEQYLVAYLGAPEALDTDQVKAFASARLPAYMIPSVFYVLPCLPLTHNGKIDQALLRERDDSVSADLSSARQMNRFETEVLDACTASLHLPSLSLDQNLFSVGATSLTVMQIVTVLRKTTDIELNLVDVYTSPTVRDLAAKLALRLH